MPIKKTTPSRSSLVKSDYSSEVFALTIGSNILHWRKWRGISQQELAKTANLTQASISDIENGEGNPTIDTLNKIAQALQVKTDLLTKPRLVRKMIEAVDYMAQKINSIDILKAMKLLYFTDLESLNKNGTKLIGLQYVRRNRGPFNQDVYQLNDIFEKKGDKYTSAEFQSYLTLTPNDKAFLDKIITHYGKYSSTELMNLSYQTPPMKGFTKGDNKGMGKIIL